MANEDAVRLRHMLDAANKVLEFSRGKTRKDLDSDEKLALALVRLLEVFGEAANALSEPFRKKHPDIPWQSIIGTRNRLVHGYFDVDFDIVWNIVTVDLPPLVGKMRGLSAQ
jgi:uncharacterized protein with HEPN domain